MLGFFGGPVVRNQPCNAGTAVLGRGGNMISDHAEAQGVSVFLLLSFCSVWNSPLQFSFLPHQHNKVPFSLLISTLF